MTTAVTDPRARADLRLHAAKQDAYYADARLRRCPDDPERYRLLCVALCRLEQSIRMAEEPMMGRGRTEGIEPR